MGNRLPASAVDVARRRSRHTTRSVGLRRSFSMYAAGRVSSMVQCKGTAPYSECGHRFGVEREARLIGSGGGGPTLWDIVCAPLVAGRVLTRVRTWLPGCHSSSNWVSTADLHDHTTAAKDVSRSGRPRVFTHDAGRPRTVDRQRRAVREGEQGHLRRGRTAEVGRVCRPRPPGRSTRGFGTSQGQLSCETVLGPL